jgi:hypothetical protein
MTYRLGWIVIVALLLISSRGPSQQPADYKEDEELLKKAGLGKEGPDLIEFFRKRTLSEAEVKRLSQLIPQLGDNDFTKRQKASDDLAAAGPPILPHLRLALSDPDQEIQRRAQECINEIEKGPGAARAIAAARMLGVKRPKEACSVLLAFLPFADDESVKEAVVNSLLTLGVRDTKVDDVLINALGDKTTVKRASAALVTGRSGTGDQRKIVQKMLSDPVVEVRLAAAQGLAAGRDKSAAPTLISLLAEAPAPIAEQAEDLLQRMAGDKAPTLTWEESKKELSHNAWQAWWKSEGEKLDLAKADVDPLMRSPVNQTRQLAQLFLDAMIGKKTVDFKKITEVPFHVSDHQTFQTHEQLEKELSQEAKHTERENVRFEMKAAMPVAEFAKREHANKKYLEKIDKRQVYTALLKVKVANEDLDFAVFVRVSAGKAKVIGVAEANEGGRK